MWRLAPLCPSARSPAGATLGYPASLSGFDGGFLGVIAGESRAQLEMRGVFHPVAPFESMLAHNPHRLTSFRRETAAASHRDPTKVHSQPGLVHRSSGPFGAVDPAPGATAAAVGAPEEGLLLGARTKSAVNTRSDAASAHIAHGRVEPPARVTVKRFEAFATQGARIRNSFVGRETDGDQTDADREMRKYRLNFKVPHWSKG